MILPFWMLFLIAVAVTAPTQSQARCSEAESAADDAYSYIRRALRESDFDSAQTLMRRARDSAEEAQSAAQECDCSEAESYADDAYTYARRGYNASDLRELRGYAQRALKAADAARSAAQSCS